MNGLTANLSPAVLKIIVLNVAICILINVLNALKPGFDSQIALLLGQRPAISWLWVWQNLTYMFIHLAPMHLLFNMLVLFFFGPELEQRWGTRNFWIYYLVSGIGAGVIHMLFTLLAARLGIASEFAPYIPVIGASGAIFAIEMAYAIYYPDRIVLFMMVLPMKIKHLMIVVIVWEVFMEAQAANDGVSHLTHLSGLAVGYLILTVWHRSWDFRTWRWR